MPKGDAATSSVALLGFHAAVTEQDILPQRMVWPTGMFRMGHSDSRVREGRYELGDSESLPVEKGLR